jgi:hypothetical protein
MHSKTMPLLSSFSNVDGEVFQEKLSLAQEYEQMPPKRRIAMQKRVTKMRAFLKGGSKSENAPPSTDNQIAQSDETSQPTPLPPLNEDFLFLSLNAMTHPTATIPLKQHPVVCRICEEQFGDNLRDIAWRLHSHNGRAHVVHVHCLHVGWADDKKLDCEKCDSLKSQMGRCTVENVKRRLERLENLLM